MIAETEPALLPLDAAPVHVLLRGWGLERESPRLRVHPDDEMLAFLVELHDGDREQAWCDYLRSGRSIADLLLQALRWRFPAASPRVLDFASGYGRVTRFLLDEIPAGRLTISDILAPAVEFQRRAFGVAAALSATEPGALEVGGPFDAILVTSLFTHLPERRFAAWLSALVERLAPGGLLLFSTHDPSLLPAGDQPASDFLFRPQSEIAALSTDDYGSTWAGERFVREALASLGEPISAQRFARAVCNYQDLWVAVRGEEIERLALRAEPDLSVEGCSARTGDLELSGWCAGRTVRPVAVEVEVDGALAGRLPVELSRPDVQAAIGIVEDRCGFAGRLPLTGADAHQSTLALVAVDERGERWLLWLGRLASCMRLVRDGQLRHLGMELGASRAEAATARADAEALRARIAAMEASRFWKLRNAWFGVKRALGWTAER